MCMRRLPDIRQMRQTVFLLLTCLGIAAASLASAQARADEIEVREARLEQVDEALVLDADFQFDFNPRLEQLVSNGVPLYFVVEFELTRRRWYWFDEKAAARKLQTRLSYHALTRQFRLSTGLLHQNFSSLPEALAVLRRVRNWTVLERGSIQPDSVYQAALRMRLDIALLPKPFQVSALTSREWHLESEWRRFAFKAPPATAAGQASGNTPAGAPAVPERRDESPGK